MRRKFCTIGYLPPADKFPTAAFLANLRKFPTAQPLILFSENDVNVSDIPNARFAKLKADPDPRKQVLLPNGKTNHRFVNNRIFLTAIGIAYKQGFTHFCYLEADCRVGCQGWDEKVFAEFCAHPRPIVIGGSAVCYNPCNFDRHTARSWCDFMDRVPQCPWRPPIATYGWKSANDNTGVCLFVNGALGIYDIAEMSRLFDMSKTYDEAASTLAWDLEIGKKLWNLYGPDVFNVVGHLPAVLSTFGDVLTTEAERLQWLREGKVCAVHQVKSNEII